MATIRSVSIFCLWFSICFLTACPRPIVNNNNLNNQVNNQINNHPEGSLAKKILNVYGAIEESDLNNANEILDRLEIEFSDDPMVGLIALARGRLLLAQQDFAGAKNWFEQLQNPQTPEQIFKAAELYDAYLMALSGSAAPAYELLSNMEELDLTWIVPTDQGVIAGLFGEAKFQSGDPITALKIFAVAFDLGDEHVRAFALSRGFEITAEMEDENLKALVDEGTNLGICVGGDPLIRRMIMLEDSEGAGLLYDLVAPVLNEAGELGRILELNQLLATADDGGALRVGILLPLSGEGRIVGEQALKGFLLAQGVFDGGRSGSVTSILEDTGSDPDQTRDAVRRLADLNVSFLIGPLGAETAIAAAEEAEEHNIPIITLSTKREIVHKGDNVFRHFIDPISDVERVVEQALKLGITDFAVIYPSIPYGERMVSLYETVLIENGANLTVAIAYDRANSDFSKAVSKLKGKKFDALFIPDTYRKVVMIAGFLAAENIWGGFYEDADKEKRRIITYLGTELWGNEELIESGHRYLQGAIIPSNYYTDLEHEANHNFIASFGGVYGSSPGLYEAFAFEALELVLYVLFEARTTRPEVLRQKLSEVMDFPGLNGTFGFDGNGNTTRRPLLLELKGQNFVPVVE